MINALPYMEHLGIRSGPAAFGLQKLSTILKDYGHRPNNF